MKTSFDVEAGENHSVLPPQALILRKPSQFSGSREPSILACGHPAEASPAEDRTNTTQKSNQGCCSQSGPCLRARLEQPGKGRSHAGENNCPQYSHEEC